MRRLAIAIVGAAVGGCAADPPQFPSAAEDTTGSSSSSGNAPTTEPPRDTDQSGDPNDDGSTHDDPTGGPPNDGGPPSETTGEPLASDAAFRLNSLTMIDPHVFASGLDVTDYANSTTNTALNELDTENADGTFGFGVALVFMPLDQADGQGGDFLLANADCYAPDGQLCTLYKDTQPFSTTYTSLAFGPCLEPDEMVLSGRYESPEVAYRDCFVTEPMDVVMVTDSVVVPLSNVRVSAQFLGDPAGNLVSGLLVGFLRLEDAQNATVQNEVLSGVLSEFLLEADMDDDGTGWWMHYQFTALTTEWFND